MTNPYQINDVFKDGKINIVIVFSENFADNLLNTGEVVVQLIADGTEPNQASMLTSYATGILDSYQQEIIDLHQVPYQINTDVRMLYNPQSKSAIILFLE